jgi:YVTN family beta-propeller protein
MHKIGPSISRTWCAVHGRFACFFVVLACGLSAAGAAVAQQPSAPGASGYHLEATWKPGGEGGWDYLTVDPEAHRLYITRTDRVQVIDTDKGTLVGEVPGLEGGHGVALAPEFNRGFASSGKNGKVVVFDLQTLKAIGDPATVGKKPDAIIYEPLTKHVFAFNGESEDATVIDAATAKVVATVALGGGPEFAVSDGKGSLFVNLEDKNQTLAIDVRKNAVLQRWLLAPGDGPTGLSLDPAKHRLFAGCHSGQMIVLDAESGKALAEPPIGKGVDACAFDPATGFAFASCGDGTLTVIQEKSDKPGEFSVVENVKTQRGARTMALDPKTHAVYLAAADYEPSPAPAAGERPKRPAMIPGSFVVLKFVR